MQISFAVNVELIRAFVFATRIVQFLFYLHPKFQASSSFLCLYSPVCVGPVWEPRWFSHEAAQIHADSLLIIRKRIVIEIRCTKEMSLLMRKPTMCIGENKGPDQLRGNREADQRLCFRYTDSTIPLLYKSKISSL